MARLLLALACLLSGACAGAPADVEAQRSPEPVPPTLRFEFERQAPEGAAGFDADERWGFSVHGAVLGDFEADDDGPTGPWDELAPTALGVQADFFRPRTALLFGVERREYDGVDARTVQLFGGARYLFLHGRARPYVEGRVSYGLGLELPGGGESDAFLGLGLGLGGILRLTPHVHLDARVAYELAPDVDLDTPAGSVDLDGWIGTLGIGFTF